MKKLKSKSKKSKSFKIYIQVPENDESKASNLNLLKQNSNLKQPFRDSSNGSLLYQSIKKSISKKLSNSDLNLDANSSLGSDKLR